MRSVNLVVAWRGQMTRRGFTGGLAAALAVRMHAQPSTDAFRLVAEVERERVLGMAGKFLAEPPVTVTSTRSERSAGGPHDYFSEGDYWWPDPKRPGGPYIRRDGFTNPGNFNAHREALIRFGVMAPTLASAWRLTRDTRFSVAFLRHLNAWFVDGATKMNPDLQYAQAISGVSTGRGTGIIDTLQLMDVIRGVRVMEAAGGLSAAQIAPIRTWFSAYVDWMATSKNGKEEELAKNNHGACWVLQAAEFAQFAGRQDLVRVCVERFKTALVPDQIAKDGSLPLELARTKPYSYTLFDCDVLSGICQSLSTTHDNLWLFKGAAGGSVADAMAFAFPYIADKGKWPFSKDVEYFDDFPSRRSSLLFTGEALRHPEYVALWRRLDASPTVPEVIRNLPIRQPLLWVDPVLHA